MIKSKGLPDIIAIGLFICYIIIGLSIVGDFGVNWDDADQRENGQNNIEYLFHHNKEPLRQSADHYHGPAFEIVLILIEDAMHIKGGHRINMMRHTVVFIYTALCLIAFYFLLAKLFANRWLPLLGCLIFVLHPRIFADSFYNPKDITSMGGMIVGVLTLALLSEKLSWWYILIHAFISAWCIDIRITCAMLPMATVGVLLYQCAIEKKHSLLSVLISIGSYLILTFIMMLPMWPILMDGPFYQLSCALKQMSNFTLWGGNNLYFGKVYPGTQTPGEYQFVWFFLTTPVIYLLTFFAGVLLLIVEYIKHRKSFTSNLYVWLSLAIFIAPPAAMWYQHSVVLEGWRHVFLIYPFFVIVCVYALSKVMEAKPVIRKISMALLCACFIFNIGMLYYLHPFEFVYFNPVANQCLAPMDKKFEIDYWGPSFKQGFEYLIKTKYKGTPLKVSISNGPGHWNYYFLPENDQTKIDLVPISESEFYLSSHRFVWEPPSPAEKLVYEFKRQGNTVLSVYKLR